jgi:hypothetical protein
MYWRLILDLGILLSGVGGMGGGKVLLECGGPAGV